MKKLAFEHQDKLDAFLKKAIDLLDGKPDFQWQYPPAEEWDEQKIQADNEHILQKCARKAGVYAIFIDEKLIYIGQTQAQTARERIKNHFIKKNPRTGSKLEQIKMQVVEKKTIGFMFIEVSPAALRHFLEENLINNLNPEWNIQGKK